MEIIRLFLVFLMFVSSILDRECSPSSIRTSTSPIISETIHLLNKFANLTKPRLSRNGSPEDDYNQTIFEVLKLEIFTVATGNHFVFPPHPNEKTERKIREISRFVRTLWLRLCTVEKMEEIIKESINMVICRKWSPLARKVMTKPLMNTILPSVIDEICKYIHDCPGPSEFSLDLPGREMKWYFPLGALRQGIVDESELADWFQNRDTRKFLIHKEFLKIWVRLNDGGYAKNVTVDSPLKVSSELYCLDKEIQLFQNVYSDVLDDISTNFSMIDSHRSFISRITSALTEVVKVDNKLAKKSEEDEYSQYKLRIIFALINFALVGVLFYYCYSNFFCIFIRPIIVTFLKVISGIRRIFLS